MAARPLHPSEYEIQREVEALRDIRRRSSTPGALAIDPDLPNQSPPTSPTAAYWSPKPSTPPTQPPEQPFPSRSDDLADTDHLSSNDPTHPSDPPNNPSDDPFHLFWVPASVHPEIAPAEFRAFLKEHARSPPLDADTRSSTLSPSQSLGRKRSMLSRQYKPKENDDPEDDKIVPIQRNRSFLYHANPGPQLTISDLQKLEELAEEAHQSDDPSRLRNVLRRSLSMNISPTALDLMDDVPDMGDEADAPIIVPPPGQILRRAARTKIRKPGLPGDGNGHRFGSRRGPATRSNTAPAEPRTSSDISSNDHSESEHAVVLPRRHHFTDDKNDLGRPDSFSEETSIYEAYARSEEDDGSYTPVSTPPTSLEPSTSPPILTDEPPQIPLDILSMASDSIGQSTPDIFNNSPPPLPTIQHPSPPPQHQQPVPQPPLHQPQPQRLLAPQPVDQGPSRTPSPAESTTSSDRHTTSHHPPPGHPHQPPNPPTRKEKDKKSLFKWGDKGSKKSKGSAHAAEKEKESGFFGSLFGKKNKDTDYQSSMTGGTSGREAAQALLGASKSSKSYVPSSSPGLAPGIGGNPYARYPIHVERAIYRLSHIKLANPRRPLYEQVLISNLMFWYLGIINKAQNPTPPANNPPQTGATTTPESDADREQREKEQKEREEKEKVEKERLERERQEKEQREREVEMKRKESGKRGSLTKATGNRRAEMPIKGPQYEMQHRVMEQEYGPYGAQPPRSPTSSTPHINGGPLNSQQQYGRPVQQPAYGNGHQDPYYYQDNSGQRAGLSPGAMAPADQAWKPQLPSAAVQQHQRRGGAPLNAGPPNRRSRSPPPQIPQIPPLSATQPISLPKLNTSVDNLVGADRHGGGSTRSPVRSLSATAGGSREFSGQVNGGGTELRKGYSAHAAVPYQKRPPRTSESNAEEEDVPLAVWQQQRGNRQS